MPDKSSFQRFKTLKLLFLSAVAMLLLGACDALSTDTAGEETITYEGAPIVTIASPLTGDTYREGVGVDILLRVDNAGPDIARVAIAVDGVIIGEALEPNSNGDPSFTVSNSWPSSGEGQHTITATVSRTDGTTAESDSVTINVMPQTEDVATSDDMSDETETTSDDMADTDTESTTEDTASTDGDAEAQADSDGDTDEAAAPVEQATTAPEPTAEPTAVPATPTSSAPQVRVTTGANIRSGPGLVFDPPIGSLAAGATAEILAVSTSGTWYRIQFYNGDGWISGSTVEVQGDTASLPREAGPATPVPPTPVPPTNTPLPASQVDLVIDGASSSIGPFPFVCLEASTLTIVIVNQGSEASEGTTVVAEDIYNGQVIESTSAPVPSLAPNQSTTVTMYLTVSTNVDELHTSRVRVDPNNGVNETNEDNNAYVNDYVLDCN